jgi:putative tryptophan/tyrosine transport system substrate-binding protein
MKHRKSANSGFQPIGRRKLIAMLGGAAAWPLGVSAQTRARPLIGALSNVTAENQVAGTRDFLDAMRALGQTDGRSYDFDVRCSEYHNERLSALAAELVALKPALIVAFDPDSANAAAKATASIPIVAAILTDPVRLGLIDSYAHPGRNLTGILAVIEGLSGKQVELASELVPGLRSIGLLINPTNVTSGTQRQQIEAAASVKGIAVVAAEVRDKSEFDRAFTDFAAARVQAMTAMRDGLLIAESDRIVELAAAAHLPSVFGVREPVDRGGLAGYGISLPANRRRAAYFVDRILKGAKPGDLPVEFPTKLELILNMKTAKALGITVPLMLQATADEAIE